MVWDQHYASVDGLDEAVNAVTVDSADDVIVCGRATSVGRGSQMLTMKLASATGDIAWMELRGGSALLDDTAWDVVVGADDHPVVTGLVVDSGDQAFAITCKLNGATGGTIWENQLPDAVHDLTKTGAWLVVQDNGDVVLCERVFGGSGYDVLLERYAEADGDLVWTMRYDGPTHGGDDPRQMIRDAVGDLIVVGVQDTAWNYNYMVLKFAAASGEVLWQAPGYDGPPGWYDVANCVTIGSGGEIVVSGASDGGGSSWDIATVAYDPASGLPRWTHRFDGIDSQTDEARDLRVAADGLIFVTGYTYGATTGKDLLVYRLTPAVPSAVDLGPGLPVAVQLAEPRPNPFNPRVTLSMSLAASGPVRLTVHDARGRLLVTLADGTFPAGEHAVQWDGRDRQGRVVAAGVYLVVLRSSEGVVSQKVVLAK